MFIRVVYDAYDNAEARNWESNQNAGGFLVLSSSFLWSLLQSKCTAVTVSVAQVYIFFFYVFVYLYIKTENQPLHCHTQDVKLIEIKYLSQGATFN